MGANGEEGQGKSCRVEMINGVKEEVTEIKQGN